MSQKKIENPTPEQLFEIRMIGGQCAADQDKLLVKKDDKRVAFFLPKEVEVVEETDEQGNTTGYLSTRYIGRIAKIGETNWRMLIAETKHRTTIAQRGKTTEGKTNTTGERTYYKFHWTPEQVTDAFKRIFKQQDSVSIPTIESISAGDCQELAKSISDFAVESGEAARNNVMPIVEQLFYEEYEQAA